MSVTPDKLDPYVDGFKPLCSSGHMNAWYGYGSGAPNENIVQNHLNIALLNVF